MIHPIVFDAPGEFGQTPRPALVEWMVNESDHVQPAAPRSRYQNAKAVATFQSPCAGYVRTRLVPEGARFSFGSILCVASDDRHEPLPDSPIAPLPSEHDTENFDWSEIDNHDGDPEPLGVMRRAIADRMAMSKRHIPCFYLTAVVDMTRCLELRRELKKNRQRATFNDMSIKASALALRENPRAAMIYSPQGLYSRSQLNIGFAAALPDDDLMVPVIKEADTKPLVRIADETRALAEKAKRGDLTPYDCSGGVFSVSYLGSYEVENFIAIVNPGESAILAMGKVRDRVVAVDGEVKIKPMACLTLSCDHRSIDGALAAKLMGDIKKRLEDPDCL
ncbi:MAG: 2-oxo acid dehydrogenase subunit E2 [Planctomycetes bacterium]|nr:2-oxo acid dehydrogenase subunit E2 [Planctomycetota bacterium]